MLTDPYRNHPPCPYCGERRPHFIPGAYCIKILQKRLEDLQAELANERDLRREELGLLTMKALFNASQSALIETFTELARTQQELQERKTLARALAEDASVARIAADHLRYALAAFCDAVPGAVSPAIVARCQEALRIYNELVAPQRIPHEHTPKE